MTRAITRWHERNRGPIRTGEHEWGTIHLERGRGALQHPNHLQSMTPAGHRLRICLDTINKMPAGQIQRFFLLQMRDITVPVMIGIMKFRERVIVRRSDHPHIVDPDFFVRLQIVVHDHALRANDGHFANLSWFKPAALNRGESLVWEEQRHVSHVFNARADMGVALAVNRNREFAEDMQDY